MTRGAEGCLQLPGVPETDLLSAIGPLSRDRERVMNDYISNMARSLHSSATFLCDGVSEGDKTALDKLESATLRRRINLAWCMDGHHQGREDHDAGNRCAAAAGHAH